MKFVFIGTIASSFILFRKELALRLIEKKIDVIFLYSYATPSEISDLQSLGITTYRYGLSRSSLNPFSNLWSFINLLMLLHRLRPKFVFTYFVKPVIYGTLAAKFLNIPNRIALIEGLGFAFTDQPFGRPFKTRFIKRVLLFLYSFATRATTQLLFLNPDDQKELLDKYRLKVKSSSVVGGIGLNLNHFSFSPVISIKSISFLFMGRLLKEKGIFEFLSAAKIVRYSYSKVNFVVVGDKDDTSPNVLSTEYLESCINSGLIEYAGFVDNVFEWIEKSSIFVLPSYREGVPRSTQEAMAVGRPILTTDVPGCRETVLNGINGFIVPPFNVEALAKKMIWFIENPDQIARMGLASRKMAEEKFDAHSFNSKLMKTIGIN